MTALFAVTLILALVFWNKSRTLQRQLNEELTVLEDRRVALEAEVQQLTADYEAATATNQELRQSLSLTENERSERDRRIEELQSQLSSSKKDMRLTIQQLETIREELQKQLQSLALENQALKAERDMLADSVEVLYSDNFYLTRARDTLAREVSYLSDNLADVAADAAFRANTFRIVAVKKSDKATAKSRKAREINIGFDLNTVPERYRGRRTLYLTLANEQGTPIKVEGGTPQTVRIPMDGNIFEIQAQQVMEVELSENQHLEFVVPLEERIQAGNYVAAVYSDKGKLGSASFYLR